MPNRISGSGQRYSQRPAQHPHSSVRGEKSVPSRSVHGEQRISSNLTDGDVSRRTSRIWLFAIFSGRREGERRPFFLGRATVNQRPDGDTPGLQSAAWAFANSWARQFAEKGRPLFLEHAQVD